MNAWLCAMNPFSYISWEWRDKYERRKKYVTGGDVIKKRKKELGKFKMGIEIEVWKNYVDIFTPTF